MLSLPSPALPFTTFPRRTLRSWVGLGGLESLPLSPPTRQCPRENITLLDHFFYADMYVCALC